MNPRSESPARLFRTQAEWEKWLEQHHTSSDGLWLKIARKGSGKRSLTQAEAVESALCFGWIDSQAKSADDSFWVQRFTPRRARSKWSQINCGRATDLVAQGRMRPAGLREMEAAKKDGRWEAAYAPASTITVPDDLQAVLDRNPRARTRFEQLDSQNRYAILFRIHDAKRPETRAARIDKFVQMLKEGRTIYPPRD